MTPKPSEADWGDDRPLPEDSAIDETFPTRSGRHDLYAEAMRLVGARRSKGALVALVNWLLPAWPLWRRWLYRLGCRLESWGLWLQWRADR